MNRIKTIKQSYFKLQQQRRGQRHYATDKDIEKVVDSVMNDEYTTTQAEKLELFEPLDFN